MNKKQIEDLVKNAVQDLKTAFDNQIENIKAEHQAEINSLKEQIDACADSEIIDAIVEQKVNDFIKNPGVDALAGYLENRKGFGAKLLESDMPEIVNKAVKQTIETMGRNNQIRDEINNAPSKAEDGKDYQKMSDKINVLEYTVHEVGEEKADKKNADLVKKFKGKTFRFKNEKFTTVNDRYRNPISGMAVSTAEVICNHKKHFAPAY